MRETKSTARVFHEGEEVVLARGTYQGTRGIFLRLSEDVKWAEIVESNGQVRLHPVEWLARPTDEISLTDNEPATADRARDSRPH